MLKDQTKAALSLKQPPSGLPTNMTRRRSGARSRSKVSIGRERFQTKTFQRRLTTA
jgi:hypothetical protein